MPHRQGELIERARHVRLLIVDVDGVMTDGGIILDGAGGESKRFHVRDGHGIKLALRHGIEVAIITGRESEVVRRRAAELGIKHVYQKCLRKLETYETIKQALGLHDREVAYVGDDVVDIPVMMRVGFPVAVADAAPEARAVALMVTESAGGHGAVREVTDFVLKARGEWDEIIAAYRKA
jgi:3-deoxy-D-manno-octulosonate 8-phosphate phosphatase (KDO 8-P phosphatase)